MTKIQMVLVIFALSAFVGPSLALAQQAPAQQPQHPMTFFITSKGSGDGANLGGLAGADKICQTLAAAVGAGMHTWHAYLSTQAANGQPAVNARDRIGEGPWYNAKGVEIAKNVADLHGDTLDAARAGNNLTKRTALTEKGDVIGGVGDTPSMHDILTGTQPDGRAYTDAADHTCHNWTSDSTGTAELGHSDRNHGPGGAAGSTNSWNATHASAGCSQAKLKTTAGEGLFYCFAID